MVADNTITAAKHESSDIFLVYRLSEHLLLGQEKTPLATQKLIDGLNAHNTKQLDDRGYGQNMKPLPISEFKTQLLSQVKEIAGHLNKVGDRVFYGKVITDSRKSTVRNTQFENNYKEQLFEQHDDNDEKLADENEGVPKSPHKTNKKIDSLYKSYSFIDFAAWHIISEIINELVKKRICNEIAGKGQLLLNIANKQMPSNSKPDKKDIDWYSYTTNLVETPGITKDGLNTWKNALEMALNIASSEDESSVFNQSILLDIDYNKKHFYPLPELLNF